MILIGFWNLQQLEVFEKSAQRQYQRNGRPICYSVQLQFRRAMSHGIRRRVITYVVLNQNSIHIHNRPCFIRYFLCRSFALSDPCTHLWCGHKSSPQLCKTKKGPPLEGTPCGQDKVKERLIFVSFKTGRILCRYCAVVHQRILWGHRKTKESSRPCR